jgi:hypothetical protein
MEIGAIMISVKSEEELSLMINRLSIDPGKWFTFIQDDLFPKYGIDYFAPFSAQIWPHPNRKDIIHDILRHVLESK